MRTFFQEIHATALIMRDEVLITCHAIDLGATDFVKVRVCDDGEVLVILFPYGEGELKIRRRLDAEDFHAFREGVHFLMIDPTRATVKEQLIAIAIKDSFDESSVGETFSLF